MVTRIPHDSDPELDARVRALLAAAAAPTEPGPLPGESGAVAAFRDARSTPSRRFSMSSSLTPVRAAVAAGLGAGVLLAAGVGGAAAGVLPGAAQDTARTWLETVGVEVPGADAHSAGHADQRGSSVDETDEADEATEESTETDLETTDTESTETESTETESTETGAELPEASQHGQTVSGTARETEAEGADKGAEVAATASEGRSKAGERTAPGAPATGEEGTDEDADDDGTQAAEGQARADSASEGRRDHGGDRRP